MGIRIHKMIGYGFCDLVENDPRIDWDRFEYVREESPVGEFESYLKLVEDRQDRDIDIMLYWRRPEEQKKWNFYDVITYDSEFGLDNVILFGHPCQPKWSRYDDAIDYYCSAARRTECSPYYERIDLGIYPYLSADLIHIETGQVVGDDVFRRMKYMPDPKIVLSGGHVYHYNENYVKDFVHDQPGVLKQIAKFSGVKDEYLHQLVPMLYEYWS